MLRWSFTCLLVLGSALSADSEPIAAQTWSALQAKREGLKNLHQEFQVSRTYKIPDHDQSSQRTLILDQSSLAWRTRSTSGSDDTIHLFDGNELFIFENGGQEFVRSKHSAKDGVPQPEPYNAAQLDLSKAVLQGRTPCGLPGAAHECLTIDVPLKPYLEGRADKPIRYRGGVTRAIFDTVTGLLISARRIQNIDTGRLEYQSETTYTLKRLSYNTAPDLTLFRLPESVTAHVTELSDWNAAQIRKQLAGKPAPDLTLTDLQGKTIHLADLKGRTVLLDFWATWCSPCRSDGPSLDKLHSKYGSNNLAIIGVSVNEDRATVQKFLAEHQHSYSIALTTENQMPQAYRIAVFPTYIIIDADGNLTAATEGAQGFGELRHLLKKAGLDTD